MRVAEQFLAYNPSQVKPGWIAFVIVMGLLAATFLLWRNMNKQMRKIKVPYKAEFDADAAPSAAGAQADRTRADRTHADPDEGEPPVER
jgi:hypothetical protein